MKQAPLRISIDRGLQMKGVKISRQKKPRIAFALLLIVFLSTISAAGYFFIQSANYHTAIETTKEWARLNEFPENATNLTVDRDGSLFTVEFVVEFRAPLADIEKWLQESPGTTSVAPTVLDGVRRYPINPGGGAQFAELEVNEKTGHVRIRTYWS